MVRTTKLVLVRHIAGTVVSFPGPVDIGRTRQIWSNRRDIGVDVEVIAALLAVVAAVDDRHRHIKQGSTMTDRFCIVVPGSIQTWT